MKKTLEILGVIVGIIVGCITIYIFLTNSSSDSPRTPEPEIPSDSGSEVKELSFLEKISGTYNLISWTENTSSGVTIYIDAKDGKMTISNSGQATWNLLIQQKGETGIPNSRIICKGELDLARREIRGTPGGTSVDWDKNIQSVGNYVWISFCGWNVGEPPIPFKTTLMGSILQMKNSKGIFKWRKI